MLGSAFVDRLSSQRNISLTSVTRTGAVGNCDSKVISNFLDEDQLRYALSGGQFDWVVNCAGSIKQQKHVSNCEMISMNALFPHKLREVLSDTKTRILHFSTDCVFSGSKGNYSDDALHDATDVYGRSKSLGELNFERCLTLRTSIIGHGLVPNASLVDWFVSNAGKTVTGYKLAYFSGLPTYYIADLFLDKIMLEERHCGVYNLSGYKIDKYQLLSKINEHYRLNINILEDESFSIDRSLNSEKFRKDFGWEPLEWDSLIEKMACLRMEKDTE